MGGDFAAAIKQAVRQYLACRRGVEAICKRPLESGRDRLIVTAGSASVAIRQALPLVLARLRDRTVGEVLADFAHSKPERVVTEAVRTHVEDAWKEAGENSPSEAETADFLSLLHIDIREVDPGCRDEERANELLRAAVLEDPAQAGRAWTKIVEKCTDMGVLSTRADRLALRNLLRTEKIELRDPATLRGSAMEPFDFAVASLPVSQQTTIPANRDAWVRRLRGAAEARWPTGVAAADGPLCLTIACFQERGTVRLTDGELAPPILDALRSWAFRDVEQIVEQTISWRDLGGRYELRRIRPVMAEAFGWKQDFVYVRLESAPEDGRLP